MAPCTAISPGPIRSGRIFDETQEVLVIFQGPHTYVSPSWYEVELSVPTWNYTAVHAYGTPRLVTDYDAFYALLDTLVRTHESQFARPWQFQFPRTTCAR